MAWNEIFLNFMQVLLDFFTMYGEHVTPGIGYDFDANGIINVMDWLEMLANQQPDYSSVESPIMDQK